MQETSRPLYSYGVDWSDRAHPSSHCWLPYSSKNSSNSCLCGYVSCKTDKSTALDFAQCAVCSLIVHDDHLAELQATQSADNLIPKCRVSFIDGNCSDHISSYDRHEWLSSTSKRSQRCEHCQEKFITNTPNNDNHRTSDGFTCLWCARGYHRRCWDNVKQNTGENKCDYGAFG